MDDYFDGEHYPDCQDELPCNCLFRWVEELQDREATATRERDRLRETVDELVAALGGLLGKPRGALNEPDGTWFSTLSGWHLNADHNTVAAARAALSRATEERKG